MRLKTPRFWADRGKLSTLLLPLGAIYGAGHALHRRMGKPWIAPVPVLCVGNIVAGGSGKTPAAIALAQLLRREGLAASPFFLTRGYGGRVRTATLADPSRHGPDDIGDEAFLLARHAPVVVAANRAEGARLAQRSGADCVIMDDGLQNRSLRPGLAFVVVDGAYGFGNGRLLPAGPLRTPLRAGMAQADSCILIGEASRALPECRKPVFRASLTTGWAPARGERYFAFCGIGRPDKFFAMLENLGTDLAGRAAFADHHPYSAADMVRLKAAADGARLLTTEKDLVRLPRGLADGIEAVPVTLRFADEKGLAAFIREATGR